MAKKINLTKGIQGRLIGGVVGGAGNAVYDKYVASMLPESVAKYGEYVKAAIGVALPMVVKNNQLIASLGDGILTVAASTIVSDLLSGTNTSTTTAVTGIESAAQHMVGAPRPLFPNYEKKVKQINGNPAKKMVSGSPVC